MLALGPDGEPRPVARASGWRLKTIDTAEIVHAPAPPLRPLSETHSRGLTDRWDRNYVHSLDWRWLTHRGTADPGESWIKPTVDLVKGETMTQLERLFAVADDANGIGTQLDIGKWTFMNTDLVVHVHRVPEGEWIGIRAETNYGPDGIGATLGTLFDERGAVAAIQQSVLVRPRHASRNCGAHFAAESQSETRRQREPRGALGYGLLHAVAVGLRPFVLVDPHGAVVLHLEHVLGDRFADAVSCALVEVDFDPHGHSDLRLVTGHGPAGV